MKRKNRTQKRWRYLKALWRRKGKRDKRVHPDWTSGQIDSMTGFDLDVWKESLPERIESFESPSIWMEMASTMDKTMREGAELFHEEGSE